MRVRDGLPAEARERAVLLLTERILGHQWYYLAEHLLCFASFGSEIGTWEIIRDALGRGKNVYLPKVLSGQTPRMCFYRIMGLEELREGYGGILEPPGDSAEYAYAPEETERTLMLMPGVAFDPCRNRLGYGKGFYDFFLADKPGLSLRAIAVGYKCQLVEELPASPTDVRPYQVICV